MIERGKDLRHELSGQPRSSMFLARLPSRISTSERVCRSARRAASSPTTRKATSFSPVVSTASASEAGVRPRAPPAQPAVSASIVAV